MKTTVALALAAIWSIALIIAAAVVPAYQSSSASFSTLSSSPPDVRTTPASAPVVTRTSATLLQENGPHVLVVVGVSLLAVAVMSRSLWRRNASARHGAGPAALAVVTLLAAFTLVSMLTIGMFVLPVTGLLAYACALA